MYTHVYTGRRVEGGKNHAEWPNWHKVDVSRFLFIPIIILALVSEIVRTYMVSSGCC